MYIYPCFVHFRFLFVKEPELSKKESTLLSAKIGTLIVYIPHYDMMSVECMKCLSGGCREAVDRILQETEALV